MLKSAQMSKMMNVGYFNVFNNLLIKSNGIRFGGQDETVSSVIGKNVLNNTLTPLGALVNMVLDFIDPKHSINAIKKK